MTGPLSTLTVGRLGQGVEAEVAAWFLACLGAEVFEAVAATSPFPAPGAELLGERDPRGFDVVIGPGFGPDEWSPTPVASADDVDTSLDVGVPNGTMSYATGLALASGALAAWRSGRSVRVSGRDVAVQLFLPSVMAASYGSSTWSRPSPPVPRGDGALSCELGAPGDRETYERLLATLPSDAGAREVAEAAQEWRLPVCDYRPRMEAEREPVVHGVGWRDPDDDLAPGTTSGGVRTRAELHRGDRRPPLADITVCELAAMWAGPLGTWLLGRLGARVIKVEPDCRLDGMRGQDGEDSAMFNALNSDKTRLDLDARDPDQRARLAEVLSSSDVVLDAFSPRVMPNLGLTHDRLAERNQRLVSLSMPAFGPGTELHHWVAYGTGVHAISGLGDCGGLGFREPSVTYPDALAGLAGCATTLACLVGRDRGWATRHAEMPILSVISPLRRFDARHPAVAGRDEGGGERLFREASCGQSFEEVDDGTHRHRYPVGPFYGAGMPLSLHPAPRLAGEPA